MFSIRHTSPLCSKSGNWAGGAKCSLKLFVSSSMHSFSSSQAEVSMAVNLILLLCYLRCYYFLTQKYAGSSIIPPSAETAGYTRKYSEEWLLHTLWLSILYSIASLVQVTTSIHRSKATRSIANDTLFVSAICTLIEPLFLHLDCEKGLFVVPCLRKAMHSEARKPSLCFLRKNSSNLALALEKELIIKTM